MAAVEPEVGAPPPEWSRSGRRWPWRTLLVFALAGPPIGAVVFAAGMAVNMAWRTGQPSEALPAFALLLIYGVPFSYWMGFPSALSAGAVVAAWRHWRGPLRAAAALGIGAGVGAATVLVAHLGQDAGAVVSLFLSCVVGTLVCWRLSGGVRGSRRARSRDRGRVAASGGR